MREIFKLRVLHFALQLYTIAFNFPLFAVASNLQASAGMMASLNKNILKIDKGDSGDPIVAIEIPSGSYFQNSYPSMQDVTSLEKKEEIITDNRTIISGSSSKFRSAREYPMPIPSSNSRYYQRITRLDNRNTQPINSDSGWKSSSGKWFNQLRRRTSSILSPTMNYDNQGYQSQSQNQGQGSLGDEPEMAATGHGHGHGGGGSYGKGVNKSAVSLLGFLSLLSLIQNVLNQTQPMAMGRRKRDTHGDDVELDFDNVPIPDWEEDVVAETTLLAPLLLPMLNAVSNAQSGMVQVECTLQPICTANQVLLDRLGEQGKSVGFLLSSKLSKMFKRQRTSRSRIPEIPGSDICGRIIRAGKSGRSGKDCKMLYKTCPELSKSFTRYQSHYRGLLANRKY